MHDRGRSRSFTRSKLVRYKLYQDVCTYMKVYNFGPDLCIS